MGKGSTYIHAYTQSAVSKAVPLAMTNSADFSMGIIGSSLSTTNIPVCFTYIAALALFTLLCLSASCFAALGPPGLNLITVMHM